MIAIHPEYIVDENAEKKAVIIQFSEWNRILSEIEELDDIRAYDRAKADRNDKAVPFEEAVAAIRA
jgi:PHD/YefM family antitoxin component YafN of YafNO toxin-antitoxin module